MNSPEMRLPCKLALQSRGRRGNRAFTMIEAMVVLILFAIGAMGLTAMTIQTIRADQANRLRTKATSMIQSKIEDFRLIIKAGGSVSSGSDVVDGLTRTWTVYNDQPSVGLKTVVVQVRWSQAPMTDARFLKYAAILGAN